MLYDRQWWDRELFLIRLSTDLLSRVTCAQIYEWWRVSHAKIWQKYIPRRVKCKNKGPMSGARLVPSTKNSLLARLSVTLLHTSVSITGCVGSKPERSLTWFIVDHRQVPKASTLSYRNYFQKLHQLNMILGTREDLYCFVLRLYFFRPI